MQQTDNRWCIYIDILGFSRFWECDRSRAYASLRALMRGISAIGSRSYPESPDRLFAHQMGDGFAIVSDFGEPSLDRPIAIASALMRYMASTGIFATAAIAEGAIAKGDFADITGCSPSDIFLENDRNKGVDMGQGGMTLSSVMGTAFICAYGIENEAPSGPFLTIDEAQKDRIPDSVQCQVTSGRKGRSLCSIDWIRYDSDHLVHIRRTSRIYIPSPCKLRRNIKNYCKEYPHIRKKWHDNLRDLLDLEV